MASRNLTQVEAVFQAALDLPADERAAFVAQACAGNESLYAEVYSLVSAADSNDSFIEKPILDLGFEVLSKSDDDALIGKLIGSYKILSRLGKGGMGQVYLAEDTRLERKVALKFLSPELVNDNWAKRQLIKEAQAVAQLDHPNICSVYGIEQENGHHFIVMQYVEGETLSQLIYRKTAEDTESLDLAQQIVGALAEAHNHGIIHRDIKPGNIMVTPSGQVKVLDFGLAKIIQRKQTDGKGDSISNLSQTGLFQGTVAYMSPEQLRGEKLDYRTDVFSIGTVLYELISGTNPHARATQAETISSILSQRPVSLNRSANHVCPHLDLVVQKCLEKDREDRFQSANELLLKLQVVSDKPSLRNQVSRVVNIQSLLLLAVVALIAIAVLYGVSQWMKLPSRMVVIPITNRTGDANLEYLANGLTDAFINRLTGLTKVQLKSPNLTFISRNGPPDPLKVGKDLGVDAVLVGNISGNHELPVLEVNLINPADGTTIWKSQYGVQLEKVLSIETDVAKNVVASFQRASADDENRIKKSRDPENTEARKEYWLGLYYLRNRDNNGFLDKAVEHFSAAINLEPSYARAHAGLSDCYAYANTVAYGKMNTKDAMTRAESSAKDAIALDESLAEAHTSLGMVNLKYYWNWQESETQFRRAIELRPDYFHAHYGYSALLTVLGRNEEAIRQGEIAKDLDPFSPPTALNYCRTLYFAHRFDTARSCFDNLVVDYPDYAAGKYARGFVYLRDRMYPEALNIFESMYQSNKRFFGPALGYTYGAMGRTSDAERVLTELLDLYKQNKVSAQELAMIYIGMGKLTEAVEFLQRSAEERYAPFPFLATDPLFPELQANPQFISLIQRYDLPTQTR
jgi:eukaryotic-like serine/threonine-protein kinase